MVLNPNIINESAFQKQVRISREKRKADKLMKKTLGPDPIETVESVLDEQYVEGNVAEITFEEDLKNALNVFVLSGKYDEKELQIIEKRLYNTISEKRKEKDLSVESVPVGETVLGDFVVPNTNFNYGVDWVEKNYIPFNSKHLHFESDFFGEELKNTSTYLKIYNNDAFDIDIGDERYIEIDGIRRTENKSGEYTYELYNINENLNDDGNANIGENLEKATKKQIEEFENKLFKFEWNVSKNEMFEKNIDIKDLEIQLQNGKIDLIQFSKLKSKLVEEEIDFENYKNPLDDPNLVASIDSSINNIILSLDIQNSGDEDEIRKKLKEAFKATLGGKDTKYKYYKPWPITKEQEDALRERIGDYDFNVLKKYEISNMDAIWHLITGYEDQGMLITPYGDPTESDIGMIDFIPMLQRLQVAHQIQALQDLTETTLYKEIDNGIKRIDEEVTKLVREDISKEYFSNKTLMVLNDEKSGRTLYILNKNIDKKRFKKQIKDRYGVDINFGVEGIEGALFNPISGEEYSSENVLEIDYLNQIAMAMREEKNKKMSFVTKKGDKVTYEGLTKEILKLRAKAVNSSIKTFKPEYYTLIGNETTQKVIKEHLHASEFLINGELNPSISNTRRKHIIDSVWRGIEEYAWGHEDVIVAKDLDSVKNEFYFMMFYDYLGFDKEAELPGTWSNFSIVDYAQNLISPENQEGIIERMGDISKNSEEYKNFLRLIEACEEIVELDEQEEDLRTSSGVANFFSALYGGPTTDWQDKFPFFGGIHRAFEAYDIKQAAKRVKAGNGTLADELLVKTLNFSGMLEQRVREISYGYKIGEVTRAMLPYIGEFILTTGAFNATRTAAAKYLPGTMGTTKLGQTYAWLMGTVAQTTANPQHYLQYTFEKMTPEFEMYFSQTDEDWINLDRTLIDLTNSELKKDLLKLKNGEVYNIHGTEYTYRYIPGSDKEFGEAFFRAFGMTWAEMSTERLGEFFPGVAKRIANIVPGGHKALEKFWKNTILAKFARRMGLGSIDDATKYMITNKIGFNGAIGEILEETINQPLSSIISDGWSAWDEGFTKLVPMKDEKGKLVYNKKGEIQFEKVFNPDFFIEVGGAVVAMQIAFGAHEIRQSRIRARQIKKHNELIDIKIHNELIDEMIKQKKE